MADYDWLVIGSGPAGENAALAGAELGLRCAIIEAEPELGGAGVNTGTVPSKALRETAVYLAEFRQRHLTGVRCALEDGHAVAELMCHLTTVTESERTRIREGLRRAGVTLIEGWARFLDEQSVEVAGAGGTRRVSARAICIATGSVPYRPAFVPFDDPDVHDSDSILRLVAIPRTLVVLGGGVIGCEYASIFAALGTKVTIIEGRDRILGSLDREIGAILARDLTRLGCEILLEREVVEVRREGRALCCRLAGGQTLRCERLLFAGGRSGNTAGLGLERIGVVANDRGHLVCEDGFRVREFRDGGLYAVGDVLGNPALASVAMEQGRVAAFQAAGSPFRTEVATLVPTGIYTIPEVSMLGETEESAAGKGIDYEVGRAHYRDHARGQIIGDLDGLVKLVFRRGDRRLLGAHVIGEGATELIHIGGTVLHFGGALDDLTEQIFNYPTLAHLFKVAARDGLARLAERRPEA